MNKIIGIISFLLILGILIKLYISFEDKIKFFSVGFDNGFKFREISLLWNLAKVNGLDDPLVLYISIPTMNSCIANFISSEKDKGTLLLYKTQSFLEKLYAFRTKLALGDDNKRCLESTKVLEKGQRLVLILKGKGVFYSEVVSNGRELIIKLPVQQYKNSKEVYTIPANLWDNKSVSIYFNRKGDARYVFDTNVFGSGYFGSEEVLFIKHNYELNRMQKRTSIRCSCEIYAQMYVIKSRIQNYNAVERNPGYRCLLEDISEDGAMIRIGGKGRANVSIKLQFELNHKLVMMYGIVKSVEYNAQMNQSRLHFECTHLDPIMKNEILAYVYKVIPQEEKDIHEALETVEESLEEIDNNENTENIELDVNSEKNGLSDSDTLLEELEEVEDDEIL